jgi:hypothetical protein
MGTEGSFPWGQRPELEVDQSLPASAEAKKMWNYTFIPPYVFKA